MVVAPFHSLKLHSNTDSFDCFQHLGLYFFNSLAIVRTAIHRPDLIAMHISASHSKSNRDPNTRPTTLPLQLINSCAFTSTFPAWYRMSFNYFACLSNLIYKYTVVLFYLALLRRYLFLTYIYSALSTPTTAGQFLQSSPSATSLLSASLSLSFHMISPINVLLLLILWLSSYSRWHCV